MDHRIRWIGVTTIMAALAALGLTGPRPAASPATGQSAPQVAQAPARASGPLRLLPIFLPTSSKRTYVYFAIEADVPLDWMAHPGAPTKTHAVTYDVRAIDPNTTLAVVTRSSRVDVQITYRNLPASVKLDRGVIQIETGFELAHGPYEVRATLGGTGLQDRGRTSLRLDVPDLSSPAVSLGSLVLGYADGPRLPIVPSPRGLVAKAAGLPVVPTLDRTFDRNDNVRLYVEPVRRDPADPLTVTIEFLNGEGRVVQSRVEPRAAGAATNVDVRAPFDLLPAGAYRLHVVVNGRAASAERDVDIVVK